MKCDCAPNHPNCQSCRLKESKEARAQAEADSRAAHKRNRTRRLIQLDRGLKKGQQR